MNVMNKTLIQNQRQFLNFVCKFYGGMQEPESYPVIVVITDYNDFDYLYIYPDNFKF